METSIDRRSAFLVPCIVAALFFLPFILNNLAFNDDFYKQLWGESHFMQDGRPLAELILRVFSLSHLSVDNVAPLTWILSVLVLGWVCSLLFIRVNFGDETSPILFTALVFCTPAFIENAFFKFDNLTMSISLAFSLIASSIFIKSFRSFFVVYMLCLGFLCLYQLAMTAYIIISILMFVIGSIRFRNEFGALKDLALKALALMMAFATYSAFKPLMPISSYAMGQGEILSPAQIISNIIPGIIKYSSLLFSIYDNLTIVILIIFTILSILYTVLHAINLANNKSLTAIISAIIIAISVPAAFLMIFGPLMVLKSQPDYLRLLIGLGSFIYMITFLAYRAVSSYKYAKTAILILSLIPVTDAISKSYVINNAYGAQYTFTNGISIGVLNSLSSSGIDDFSEIKYTTHGPASYETEKVMKDYPFTRKLIRGGFVAIPHWAGYEHQSKVKVGEWVTEQQTKEACSGHQIAKHINYDIYIQGKIAFVDLTKSKCKSQK